MTNAVYSMTVRALAGAVSERAAETMLRSAIREQHLRAEDITVQDMQRLISGPLLSKLSMALPVARAKSELQALSKHLEAQYPKAPTLFTENASFAAWDESPEMTSTRWEDFGLTVDDFEFDEPEYNMNQVGREYTLVSRDGQDELIQALGRLSGVQGVMICSANGEILHFKAIKNAPDLGGVVAATAMLFQKRSLKLMSAEVSGQTICMRPVGAYCIAVVAGYDINVGRLLMELQQLKVAA